MKNTCILLTAFCVLGSAEAKDAGPFHFDFQKLADGIWTGVRADGPRYPVMGNVTFVITDDGVVVYDGGGVALMAEQTIKKIRSLTKKPVTDVVISHWHGDHNFGIYRYAEEYPGVRYIAHEFTNRAMHGATMDYIDNYPKFSEESLPRYQEMVATNKDSDGEDLNEYDRQALQGIIDDSDIITAEFNRVQVTVPTVVFDKQHVIESGDRRIELLYLGDGNTEGDIVMWLPQEKIVATGDLVVLPSPYAFNVPPRKWANTLHALNALGYKTLVPGHGPVQQDTRYVDLIIETASAIADQRDALVKEGISVEEIPEMLDFSKFEERYTGGDGYIKRYYDDWFEGPLRAAAIKELTGEPMKAIEPSKRQNAE